VSAEVIARALALSRPGYRIAHFREAALPIFQVSARLLLLERKELTAIEEACLNAVSCGLNALHETSAFLGLAEVVVRSTVASLSVRELVNVTANPGRGAAVIALTAKGRTAQATASSIVPSERLVPVLYDPFLKCIVYRHRSQLYRPREVREAGFTQIPLGTCNRPEKVDIPVQQLTALAARIPAISEKGIEILAVNRIEKREMLFTPAVLLFYLQEDGRDVQVSVVIDGEPSHEHERALRDCGADKLLGAHLVANSKETVNIADLTSHEARDLKRQAEIEESARTPAHSTAPVNTEEPSQPAVADAEEDTRDEEVRRRALQGLTFRLLRCYEHPELLTQALTIARSRLLIVSPWIRNTVVDHEFVEHLTARLKAGVAVSIGYGLEDDRKPAIDDSVKRQLEALGKSYPKFTLKYVGNTHRKVLVCDRRFAVTTSFNWLSFRGDAYRPARDESGTYIGSPEKVDVIYDDAFRLIREGYRHPTEFVQAASKAAPRRDSRHQRKH
jgi:hypothetical protein